MSADPARVLESLRDAPGWFLHQLDLPGERALLVALTPAEIRAAAFLDERVLGANRAGFGAPLARVDATQWQALFDALLAAFARRPPGTERVVVKATSSANALIDPWLAQHGARAVLLSVRLAPYLATILKSTSARSDALTF